MTETGVRGFEFSPKALAVTGAEAMASTTSRPEVTWAKTT